MPKEITIVANWKMHKTKKEIAQWFADFKPQIVSKKRFSIIVDICPPLPYSQVTYSYIRQGSTPMGLTINLGTQNVSQFEEGSFTGEVSAKQLKDLECSTVIIGHSECRQYLHETDEEIAKKAMQCLNYDLQPIICISEINQVQKLKELITNNYPPNPSPYPLTIAFEPLFAISPGRPDTAEDAQKMALEIKRVLGQDTKVIYGGSADSKNAVEFLKQPDIEGLLVGKASLDPKEFLAIIKSAASISHID